MKNRKYHYETKLVRKKGVGPEQLWLWGIVAISGYIGFVLGAIELMTPKELFFPLFMGIMGTLNFVARAEQKKVRVYDEAEPKKSKMEL